MSGNGSVTVPPDSTGKIIDCTSLSVGGVVAMRQRVIIADPTSSAGFASVTSGRLNVNVGGLVSLTGTVVVAGTVSLADGAAVNISTMPAVSIAAGTNQIGYLQKISAAVVIASLNGLGKIDGISAAVVLAAGAAHVGEVSVVGAVTVSNSVNVNGGVAISGTASVVVGGFLDPSGQQRNVVDSANTALRVNVVAGGAGGGAVFGQVANGASLSTTNLPVLMGGTDSAGGGVARTILTDTTGRLIVGSVGGTVVVAGNVSATIIGTPTIQGNVSATIIGSVNVNGGVAISGTAVTVCSGFFEVSAGSTTTVRVGDSANNALRVNLVAQSANVAISGTVAISSLPNVSATIIGTATIQGNVSATVIGSLPAGTNNIGAVNAYKVKLSASAAVADNTLTTGWADTFGRQVTILNHPSLIASATQGPLNKDITATTMAALVVSAGANCIYVTGLLVTNGSATLTRCEICSSDQSAAPQIVAYLAASGGGFSRDFHPPWKLSAGTALHGRLGSGVSGLSVTAVIHFYVGAS